MEKDIRAKLTVTKRWNGGQNTSVGEVLTDKRKHRDANKTKTNVAWMTSFTERGHCLSTTSWQKTIDCVMKTPPNYFIKAANTIYIFTLNGACGVYLLCEPFMTQDPLQTGTLVTTITVLHTLLSYRNMWLNFCTHTNRHSEFECHCTSFRLVSLSAVTNY